jgi:hypothetical protein
LHRCPAILAYTSPKPFLVSIFNSLNKTAYFSKTVAKYTSTIAQNNWIDTSSSLSSEQKVGHLIS